MSRVLAWAVHIIARVEVFIFTFDVLCLILLLFVFLKKISYITIISHTLNVIRVTIPSTLFDYQSLYLEL